MSNKKISNSNVFTEAFASALKLFDFQQKIISDRTGIPTGRISEYATGKIEPGLKVLIQISDAFGLTLADFIALGGDDPPDYVVNPEIQTHLDGAKSILEKGGPNAEALKTIIQNMKE